MGDEIAFLSALRSAPDDDTTRLVFADWLDDHNQPLKAQYLRLMVTIARSGDNLANSNEAQRLVGLSVTLSDEWRRAAGLRFALLLTRFYDNVKTIKFVRELTGCSLLEAKMLTEGVGENQPSTLISQITFEDALRVHDRVCGWDFLAVGIALGRPHGI